MLAKRICIIAVALFVGLGCTQTNYALTNEEMLRGLDEKLVSGEISEGLYKELKAKYSGKKTQPTASITQAKQTGNLIQNGDFEGEFKEGVPHGWNNLRNIECTSDNQVFHGGSKSVRLHSDSKIDSAGLGQTVSVTGGKSYTLTAWRKQQGIQSESEESLTCEIEAGSKKQYINMGVITGDSDWKKFMSKIQVPQDISEITIKFFYWHAQGTSWIDDVSLYDVEALSSAPQVSQEELLPNGDFEQTDAGDTTRPSGWKPLEKGVIGEATAGGKYVIEGYQSKKSVCASQNESGLWTGWETTIKIQPSTEYIISGYVRAVGSAQAQIVFPELKDKTEKKEDWDIYVQAGEEWKPFKKVIKIKSDAPTSSRVLLLNEGMKADLYFDNVSIKQFSPGESIGAKKWAPDMPDVVLCGDVSRWKIEGSANIKTKLDPDMPLPDGSPSLKVSADFPSAWTEVSIIPPEEIKISVPGGRLIFWINSNQTFSPAGKIVAIFRDPYGDYYKPTIMMMAEATGGEWKEFRTPLSWDPKTGKPALKYPLELERIVVYSRGMSRWDFWIGKAKIDLKNVWFEFFAYERDAISPDLPATPLFFGLDWAYGEYEHYYPKEIFLNLELPVEVKLSNWETITWGKYTQYCKMEKIKVNREGKEFTRYRMTYPLDRPTIAVEHQPGGKRVFYYLSTKLQEGSVDAYYYLEVDGYSEPPKKLPLDVVRIKEVPTPKYLEMESFTSPEWPGVLEVLKKLGMNRVYVNEEDVDVKWVDEARRRGFEVETPMKKEGMQRTLLDGGAPSQVNLNGKETNERPCYTRADKKIKYVAKVNRSSVDKHITTYFFDDESHHHIQCFCPECLKGFEEFRQRHGKELPDESPTEFCKRYEELQAQKKQIDKTTDELWNLWIDYHYTQYSRVAGLIKQEMDEYAQIIGLPAGSIKFWDCWNSAIRDKLTARYAEGKFDYFSRNGSYGSNSREEANLVLRARSWLEGTKVKHYPLYGPGLCYWSLQNFEPREIMKWNILEAFAVGLNGISMYDYWDIDLMDYKYYSEALWTVLPVEDIVVKGERAEDNVKLISGDANLRALKLNGEYLVLVSEYMHNGNTEVMVNLDGVKQGAGVWNLNERKLVGKATGNVCQFKAQISPPERAVMFYVGERDIK